MYNSAYSYEEARKVIKKKEELLIPLKQWCEHELIMGNRSKASRIFKVYNRLKSR